MLFRIIVPFGWYILGAMGAGGTLPHDINLEKKLNQREFKNNENKQLLYI